MSSARNSVLHIWRSVDCGLTDRIGYSLNPFAFIQIFVYKAYDVLSKPNTVVTC